MAETRIAARLYDADLLAAVKAAAATYRARLIHWTGSVASDANLQDANVVVLESPRPETALQDLHKPRTNAPAPRSSSSPARDRRRKTCVDCSARARATCCRCR